MANFVEKALHNGSPTESAILTNFKGTLALILLIVPLLAASQLILKIIASGFLYNVVILYLCLGAKSLDQHASSVAAALNSGNLDAARIEVSKSVSRDTAKERPVLGLGRRPAPADINRARRLVRNGLWIWISLSFLFATINC